MKHKKILFANLNAFSCNKGCMALGESTLVIFDKVLRDKGYSYEFILTDSELTEGKHTLLIGEKKIEVNAVPAFRFKFVSIIKSIVNGTFLKYIKSLKSADCILDIGHGDSFADIYGKGRFNDIDHVHKLCRFLGKPYAFLPQTIGPFNDKVLEQKAKKSLACSECVMARDHQSMLYTEKLIGKAEKVNETIDVAFALPYIHSNKNNGYINVGLNVSALLYNGGYTQKNEFGIKDNYSDLIKSIINMFLDMDNVKIHLLPHVVLERAVIENDYFVCSKIARNYDDSRVVLAPFFFGASEAKSYISNMDFFIGARMHSTIGAFSSGVPVVPLAYSRKFNGLFVQTLNYKWLCDLKSEDNISILAKLHEAFEDRIELKKVVENRMKTIVQPKLDEINNIIVKLLKL